MSKVIITNSSAFFRIVENSDLKDKFKKEDFLLYLLENIKPPFDFDQKLVFGIAAGDKKIGLGGMNLFQNLKVISRFGKGIDNIDVEAAAEKNVAVANVSLSGIRSVSELAISFILALSRNILGFNSLMKEKKWERFYGNSVFGKKLGIVGLGNIGKEVAKTAKNLGMNVFAFDANYDENFLRIYGIEKKDFETLLKTSNFLSLHLPFTEQTKNLIGDRELDLMMPTVYLINTSRGEIVDEKALLDALENNKIAGAALDVFSKEPPFENEVLKKLISHPKVIATPHIASFTPEAHYEAALKVFENITKNIVQN